MFNVKSYFFDTGQYTNVNAFWKYPNFFNSFYSISYSVFELTNYYKFSSTYLFINYFISFNTLFLILFIVYLFFYAFKQLF